jgi:hypothetical protein
MCVDYFPTFSYIVCRHLRNKSKHFFRLLPYSALNGGSKKSFGPRTAEIHPRFFLGGMTRENNKRCLTTYVRNSATLAECVSKQNLGLERTLQAAQLSLAYEAGGRKYKCFGNLEIKRNSRSGPALENETF